MNKNKLFSRFFVLGMAVASQIGQAAAPATMSTEDIGKCMRTNVFERGSVRDFQIKATDREGRSKTLQFKAFWKPTKTDDDIRITLQVMEPDNLAGTAYLILDKGGDEQLFIYLPALERVRQIAGAEISQKLWGSDLTIADVKQIQGLMLEGQVKRLADQSVGGRTVYMLETTTDMAQSGYRLVRSYIDQESCILVKAELYTDGEKPHKVLEADMSSLMKIDPWWVVLGYRMTDHRSGGHTDLQLSDIFIQERLPESLFTLEGFHVDRE